MAGIHGAMDRGLYCRVLVLLGRSENVDAKDDGGMTILMKCCYLEDARMARHLVSNALRRGAKKSLADASGRNVLCHAAISNRTRIAGRILRDEDVDLLQKDNEGNTALHLAAARGHLSIVKMITSALRKYDLPVDVRNDDGMTPLLLACRHGYVDCARYLVNECHASLTMRDDQRFMAARDWLMSALVLPPQLDIFDPATPVGLCSKPIERSRIVKNKCGRIGENRLSGRPLTSNKVRSTTRVFRSEFESATQDFVSRSLSRESTSVPEQQTALLQLFAMYSIQNTSSYRPPLRPPPPPNQRKLTKTGDVIGHDDSRSRRQMTRSRFQKVVRLKRAESILASLRRGAASAQTGEPTRRTNETQSKTSNRPDNLPAIR